MIRIATAPQSPAPRNHEVGTSMATEDTLARALADVRRQRAVMEAEHERISSELVKLRLAEKSLAALVEGTPIDDLADDQPKRRRASGSEEQPRAGRGPRGPRANSAKGRLKALLEEAGPHGLSHAEIAERLSDVAPNTLSTYLSVMSNSGELERHGDGYRTGASDPPNDDDAEDDHEDSGSAKAAE